MTSSTCAFVCYPDRQCGDLLRHGWQKPVCLCVHIITLPRCICLSAPVCLSLCPRHYLPVSVCLSPFIHSRWISVLAFPLSVVEKIKPRDKQLSSSYLHEIINHFHIISWFCGYMWMCAGRVYCPFIPCTSTKRAWFLYWVLIIRLFSMSRNYQGSQPVLTGPFIPNNGHLVRHDPLHNVIMATR